MTQRGGEGRRVRRRGRETCIDILLSAAAANNLNKWLYSVWQERRSERTGTCNVHAWARPTPHNSSHFHRTLTSHSERKRRHTKPQEHRNECNQPEALASNTLQPLALQLHSPLGHLLNCSWPAAIFICIFFYFKISGNNEKPSFYVPTAQRRPQMSPFVHLTVQNTAILSRLSRLSSWKQ